LGLEAASMEEVLLAINAGTEASRIVFDSPAKNRQEILHLRDHCRGSSSPKELPAPTRHTVAR
jgi:diaminopimelate decarboxylase